MDNIRAYEVRDGGSIPSWRTNSYGSVAEWPMASVLKTEGPKGPVSSNLTASAKYGK